MFGFVVTSFVHIGGVLLTFSYLIVPAVCGNYLASKLRPRLLIGWTVATLASIVSLVVTPVLDLPVGAAIVCALGIALVLVAGLARFVHTSNTNSPAQAGTSMAPNGRMKYRE
jgi:zinc/manganese transport system permease protein